MSATITAIGSRSITTSAGTGTSTRKSVDASAARTHLRITARGRAALTIAVVIAALAIVAGFVLTGGNAVATSTSGDVHFDHVSVAAGETLWAVAEDVAPDSDPRDVITDIVQLNNLDTTQVLPGQSLAIPTKYTK